jgi:murein DD-endopeptidase MepM/ murein hydrolase activator NlpD
VRALAWALAGLALGLPLAGAAELIVDPTVAAVGGLVVVRTSLPEPTGTFDGQPLGFFRGRDGAIALVGIDLDHAAGRFPVEVAADGERLRLDLEVVAREFPEERLTVPREYTELDRRTLARVERERKRLAAIWSKASRQRYWAGSFAPPADGPAGSPFGLKRFFNGEPRSPHAGIDFKAAAGEPVRAANRGRVALAEPLFFTGSTVVLDHGLGLYTMYVHLSKIEVARGALVERGQVVGRVGATGRATGPHLHFAARIGDARIDPATLLGRLMD